LDYNAPNEGLESYKELNPNHPILNTHTHKKNLTNNELKDSVGLIGGKSNKKRIFE
jgi:hypothetical protein